MATIKGLVKSEADANCRDNGDDGTSSDGIINAMYGGTLEAIDNGGAEVRLGPGQIVRPATENRCARLWAWRREHAGVDGGGAPLLSSSSPTTQAYCSGCCSGPACNAPTVRGGAPANHVPSLHPCCGNSPRAAPCLLSPLASSAPFIFRPAHIASQNGLLKVLKFLVKAGCDVNARNATGQTPLHMAVEYNYPKIVNYLLKIGADPELKNKAGWCAVHGIDGVKNPDSPDFQLNAILGCKKTASLVDALVKATAPKLDIGKVANFKITSSREIPEMWDEECQQLLKDRINAQRAA